MIRIPFNFLDKQIYLRLYKSLVRLKIEFNVQAWSSHLRKDQGYRTFRESLENY